MQKFKGVKSLTLTNFPKLPHFPTDPSGLRPPPLRQGRSFFSMALNDSFPQFPHLTPKPASCSAIKQSLDCECHSGRSPLVIQGGTPECHHHSHLPTYPNCGSTPTDPSGLRPPYHQTKRPRGENLETQIQNFAVRVRLCRLHPTRRHADRASGSPRRSCEQPRAEHQPYHPRQSR